MKKLIVRIYGGLGNQLFQYATAYTVAKNNDCLLELLPIVSKKNTYRKMKLQQFALSKYVLSDDSIPIWIKLLRNRYGNKILQILKISNISFGNWAYYYDYEKINNINTKKHIFLDGYWQNAEFFNQYRDDIVSQITPIDNIPFEVSSFINRIKDEESVALHIRRGDFLKKENQFLCVKEKYYSLAINQMIELKPNVKFYIFSDDSAWCREHFPNYELISFNNQYSDIWELICMANCKNNINSNSSFSWWSSFMNTNLNKIIITPEYKYYPNRIPSNWYIIRNSGILEKGEMFIEKKI